MAQGVEGAGEHLHPGQAHGVFRVQNGEPGRGGEHPALDLGVLIGDDGPAVHLRPGAGGSDPRPQGDGRGGGGLVLDHLQVPQIFLRDGLSTDDLAAVNDGAAAYRQHQVDLVVPGQLGALFHLFPSGVGHDAGELSDCLAGLLQNAGDLVVDAVALDGTAAIGQQDIGAIGGQNAGQVLFRRPFAEIDFSWVFVNKVFHGNRSFQRMKLVNWNGS